jgi:Fur family ferric uptake transcriptional regulator
MAHHHHEKATADQLLDRHGLRATPIRGAALELFLSSPHALTHQMIEAQIGGQFDRVTLYRTLKSFEEKGLIHRIADDSDSVRYALCHDCGHERHEDDHVHFKCATCGHTFCLDALIPAVAVPPRYRVRQVQMLVTGTCEACLAAETGTPAEPFH